jgi:hypothetical protein
MLRGMTGDEQGMLWGWIVDVVGKKEGISLDEKESCWYAQGKF